MIGTSATAVPCALRLATPDVGRLASAHTARVQDGVLLLDDTALRVGRLIDASAPRLTPEALAPIDVTSARRLLTRELPTKALDDLARADPVAVPQLLGRGSGLTPSGDDVLCGWLATHHAAGVDVPAFTHALADSRRGTTMLAATLLGCALHGEVLPEFGRLLRALSEPAAGHEMRDAAVDLVRVGHTSGTALLLGAGLALTSLAARPGRTCVPEPTPTFDPQRSRCA